MSNEHETILVTGAAGFIGANLCRRLVEEGQRVHAVVREASRMWRLSDVLDRLVVHEADICDRAAVETVVGTVRPRVIYHLATHGAYPYQDDATRILLTNVFGLWNVLNACNSVGYALFVNVGSSSEYGQKGYAMRETDVLDPNSFYAVAKSGQTLLCQHVARTQGRTIVTIRPFAVYGPYEEPTRLIPKLMCAVRDRTPIDMVSPTTSRDFVYIDDVIDVLMRMDALAECAGEILNVGTGVQTSLREVVDITSQLNGEPVRAQWGKLPPRIWDTDVWVADISKIYRLIGWKPQVTVREGLSKCLDWFARHRDLYPGAG